MPPERYCRPPLDLSSAVVAVKSLNIQANKLFVTSATKGVVVRVKWDNFGARIISAPPICRKTIVQK